MKQFKVIKKATLGGVGIYKNSETGAEFNVWKFRRFNGSFIYENSDGERFDSIERLLLGKLIHQDSCRYHRHADLCDCGAVQ